LEPEPEEENPGGELGQVVADYLRKNPQAVHAAQQGIARAAETLAKKFFGK
jgi:hypothetical protein